MFEENIYSSERSAVRVTVAETPLESSVQEPSCCDSIRVSFRGLSRQRSRGGPECMFSILLDNLLSWDQTLHRDALPAVLLLEPQSQESSAAVLHGSSGPDPPEHSAMVS